MDPDRGGAVLSGASATADGRRLGRRVTAGTEESSTRRRWPRSRGHDGGAVGGMPTPTYEPGPRGGVSERRAAWAANTGAIARTEMARRRALVGRGAEASCISVSPRCGVVAAESHGGAWRRTAVLGRRHGEWSRHPGRLLVVWGRGRGSRGGTGGGGLGSGSAGSRSRGRAGEEAVGVRAGLRTQRPRAALIMVGAQRTASSARSSMRSAKYRERGRAGRRERGRAAHAVR